GGLRLVTLLFRPVERVEPSGATEEFDSFLRLLLEDTDLPLLLLDDRLAIRCCTPALRRLLAPQPDLDGSLPSAARAPLAGGEKAAKAARDGVALLRALGGPPLLREVDRVLRSGRQAEWLLTVGILKEWL